MLRVNVRQFNRGMYSFLKSLPIIVYNKKTKKDLFKVVEIGGDKVDTFQSDKL